MRNLSGYILLFSFLFINSYYLSAQNSKYDSQKRNLLSKTEYSNIKVNNINLKELQDFKGEVKQLSELLNLPFQVELPDPEVRTFYNNSIRLAYGDATHQWSLYYIEILNSVIPMEIFGKKVKIGDDISILGLGTNLKSLPIEGGKRSAVFVTPYDTSFIGIHFDPLTNKITKIEYVSPT